MRKENTILRFLVTYLCVLLPLLSVTFFVTQNLLTNVQIEEKHELEQQLIQAVNAFDEFYADYEEKSIALFNYYPFSSNLFVTDPYINWEGIRLLKNLKLFDTTSNEIFVYYGDDRLYGSNGLVTPYNYFYSTLNCNSESIDNGIDALSKEDNSVTVLHNNTGSGCVMYRFVVGKDSMNRLRSIVYIVDFSEVAKMIADSVDTWGVCRVHFGEVSVDFLTTQNSCVYLPQGEVEKLYNSYSNSPVAVCSKMNNIRVQIWYDEAEQLYEFRKLRNTNIVILIVGVFLSTMISLGLSYKRMNSVKEIVNSIVGKNISRTKKKNWTKNEFDYIQALVNESINDSNLVKKNARNYRVVLLQQLAMMIFQGVLRDKNEIQALLSVCGTELVEDYFYLLGIRLDDKEDAPRLETYLQADIHYSEGTDFVVFCELPRYDHDLLMRSEMASRLLTTLKSVGLSVKQIVMSQVYNHISMTNYAYLEVRSMLDYQSEFNDRSICWEDLIASSNCDSFGLNNEYLQQFYKAIDAKELKQAEKLLDNILAMDANADAENVRYARYMVLQALRLSMRTNGDLEVVAYLQERINLVDLNDDGFGVQIHDIVRDFCQKSNTKYNDILRFVNENYTSYDLSLEKIADTANISKSQMSKIFRAHSGESYIDYVTNLRMNKAKELLRTTNMSVKEIFSNVGYIDHANASKKFKSLFGVTPSGYRAQHQISQNSQNVEEDTKDES